MCYGLAQKFSQNRSVSDTDVLLVTLGALGLRLLLHAISLAPVTQVSAIAKPTKAEIEAAARVALLREIYENCLRCPVANTLIGASAHEPRKVFARVSQVVARWHHAAMCRRLHFCPRRVKVWREAWLMQEEVVLIPHGIRQSVFFR